MSWRRWRGSEYDLAIINRHYLQLILERQTIIMAAQDDLKASVAKAVDVMQKMADHIQKNGAANAEAAALAAAATDASAQLNAASDAAAAVLPGTPTA
jgi:hypothetical protein